MIYSNGTCATSASTWDTYGTTARWANDVIYDHKYATKEEIVSVKHYLECSLFVLEDKFKKLENVVKEKYHISDEEFDELMKIGD